MLIYKNAKRDLSIVAMLGEGATQTDVGKEYGITSTQVRNVTCQFVRRHTGLDVFTEPLEVRRKFFRALARLIDEGKIGLMYYHAKNPASEYKQRLVMREVNAEENFLNSLGFG